VSDYHILDNCNYWTDERKLSVDIPMFKRGLKGRGIHDLKD
jgi:hypothetical protein